MTQLILSAKFGKRWSLWGFLSQALLEHLPKTPRIDALIPMPLSKRRLSERGYNQAAEIAKYIGRMYSIPVYYHVLSRSHETPHQTGLTLLQRKKNLQNAFSALKPLTGLRLALIDDVMTSGASLHELAKTAYRAGALHVECWVLARAL